MIEYTSRRFAAALLLTAACAHIPTALGEQASSEPTPRQLETVAVSAADSGPHIWEYRRGDNRVLVLGVVFPEPRNLDFIPNTIGKAIGAAGAVLGPPGVVVGEDVGLFRALTLWPSVRRAKYLPDGKQLADMLPPPTLQRWNTLKAVYLAKERDVDRMLPMYAGWKLYEALLDKEDIERKSSILPMVKRAAKTDGIEILDAKFHLKIDDPKKAVHEFSIDPGADLACLESTMSGVETLPGVARSLANAWSGGDVEAMRTLLDAHTIVQPCWSSLTNEAIARQQGLDLDQQTRKSWSDALERAAGKHAVVFTTAQVGEILRSTGRIRWLLDAGYVLVETNDRG